MKKIVRIITLVIATVAMFTLAACNHTHTYDTEKWTYDATMHWHAATCNHTNEKSGIQGHIGMTEDGACDVCDYKDHEHVTNNIGICTICGFQVSTPDVSTVAKAIDVAVKQGDIVSGGHVKTISDFIDYSSQVTAIYEVGEGYSHTVEYYDDYYSWVLNEKWYMAYGENQVMGLMNVYNEIMLSTDEVDPQNVDGYYFNPAFIGHADTFYGVEDLVASVYAIAIDETKIQGDLVETVEDGVYTLAFTYIIEASEDVLNVVFSFTLGENYNFETVNAYTESFYYPVYDEETGLYVIEEGAEPDAIYTLEVVQAVGTCVPCPFDVEELCLEDFTLIDETGAEVGETVTATQGQYLVFSIVGTPEDRTLTYEDIVVSGVNLETDETLTFEWYGNYVSSIDKYSNSVSIEVIPVGEYEITISSRFASKTFTLVIEQPEVTEIYASINDERVTEYNAFTGSSLSIDVKANRYADSAHEIAIVAPVGSQVTDLTISETTGMYDFIPDVAGTYVITATSTVNEEITTTLTITVEEAPAITDVLSGTWEDGWGITLEFAPDATPAEGAIASGSATLTMPGRPRPKVYTLTYVYADGNLNVSHDETNTNGYVFAINSSFGLSIMEGDWEYAVLTQKAEVDNPAIAAILDKTFAGELGTTTCYFSFTIVDDAGKATFSDASMPMMANFFAVYSWEIGDEIEDGIYEINVQYLDGMGDAPAFVQLVVDINYGKVGVDDGTGLVWFSVAE